MNSSTTSCSNSSSLKREHSHLLHRRPCFVVDHLDDCVLRGTSPWNTPCSVSSSTSSSTSSSILSSTSLSTSSWISSLTLLYIICHRLPLGFCLQLRLQLNIWSLRPVSRLELRAGRTKFIRRPMKPTRLFHPFKNYKPTRIALSLSKIHSQLL